MKGLLWKDFYMAKKYCKSFLFIIVVFAIASAGNPKSAFFLIYPVVITSLLPISLMSYDEKSKWVLYADALPFSRALAVSAKYVTVCVALVGCLLVTEAAQVVRMLAIRAFDPAFLLNLCWLYLIAGLTLPGIMLPILFKFGTEKGRIVYYISIGCICGIAGIFATNRGMYLPDWPFWLLAIGALILFLCSWLIAVGLYRKRELA